jgi:hypothetical protein
MKLPIFVCHLIAVSLCRYVLLNFTDSVQKSLEHKFARHGGSIPVTPSESYEKRISVSCHVLILVNSPYALLFSRLINSAQ